jgi:MarR family transcriptional regulator, lower aerobic nicotinate degradation pathway regulator
MSTIDPQTAPLPRPRLPREFGASPSYALKRLGMLLKARIAEALEPTGLSSYHHAVLALLEEEPSETQAQIADALGYDRSHLVGVLDELEKRGLIARERDPDDRRRHVVSLTPDGKRALDRLRALTSRTEDEFFAMLDPGERSALQSLLSRVLAGHDPRCPV